MRDSHFGPNSQEMYERSDMARKQMSHAPARERVHELYGVRRMCLRDNMPACERAPTRQLSLIHAWLSKPQFMSQ